MTKHKTLKKIGTWVMAISMISFVVVVAAVTINYQIVTADDMAKLDVSDLVDVPQYKGLGIYQGIAAFKRIIETLNGTQTLTHFEYYENNTLAIHRAYTNMDYEVSHIVLNSSMWDAFSDTFKITEEIFQEGYQYYAPYPTPTPQPTPDISETSLIIVPWHYEGVISNGTELYLNSSLPFYMSYSGEYYQIPTHSDEACWIEGD